MTLAQALKAAYQAVHRLEGLASKQEVKPVLYALDDIAKANHLSSTDIWILSDRTEEQASAMMR